MGQFRLRSLENAIFIPSEIELRYITLHIKNHILKIFDFVDGPVFKHFSFMIIDDVVILNDN